MKYPFKIALRYIFTLRKFHFITFISILSALGIMIGVAALIIVTSLFNGFRSFAVNEIIGLEPHIRIYIKNYDVTSLRNVQDYLKKFNDLVSFSFFTTKAIVEKNQNTRVVQLFVFNDTGYNKHPIFSKLVFNINSNKNVVPPVRSAIIGFGLADALRLMPGNNFSVLTVDDIDYAIMHFSFPTKREFSVLGIFQTNNPDYDNNYVFLPTASLVSIEKVVKSVTYGIDIRLNSIDIVEKVATEIRKNFPKISVFTWYDLNKDIMNAMQFEKYAVFIILSLIISIAVFNVLASLFMTVIEKKPDIAILLALGSTQKEIESIFKIQGIIIGIISTFVGLIVGLGFTLAQIKYGFIKLNTQKYIISTLPMEISIPTIVAIVLVSIFLTYLATIYPSKKASKIVVAESIFKE
ncbi:MAG: ABC transporter permease [Ignavibacteria bacterium]|nr:ABC transporter permease [Ignavibacteria bacterium]